MTQFWKHISIHFLTTVLLIGQVGFSVHSLYCLCKNEWKVSIFEQEDRCLAKQVLQAPKSCCSSHKSCSVDPTSQKEEHKGCASKESAYVQNGLQSVIVDQQNLNVDLLDIAITHPVPAYFAGIIIEESDVCLHPNKAPPIRPSGKQLLPFIQSFLC